MCLVLVGWRTHPDYRLIVAANRDEYHVRRSTSLQLWPETQGLIAGRDLDSGTTTPGVWLGFRSSAPDYRFAAITNVHASGEAGPEAGSRGSLARDFLSDDASSPGEFAQRSATTADAYQGYQLLISDTREMWWSSNEATPSPMRLQPGFYAIGNDRCLHTLTGRGDAVSPRAAMPLKARRGLEAFATIVDTAADDVESYFTMLSDRTPVPVEDGQADNLPPTLHRLFSARFVSNTLYGTRSSTVILVGEDGTYSLGERSYGPRGRWLGEVAFDGRLAHMGGAR
jgi:uncharacterized protein with NRDE domain